MTQQDVLDFLKKNNGKWLFARDIKNSLDISSNCINKNLKNLREGNLIDFKKEGKRSIFIYRYKD